MRRPLWLALSGWAIVLVAGCGGGGDGSSTSSTLGLQSTAIAKVEAEGETGLKNARVIYVGSGTRIQADLEDRTIAEDIRYIGITVSDPDKVLKDGRTVRQAAFELNLSLACPTWTGKSACTESPVQLESGAVDRDVVGNYFRYVYANGEMINIALVAAGLATVRDNPTDTTYQAELLAAQEDAKANQRGVWEP